MIHTPEKVSELLESSVSGGFSQHFVIIQGYCATINIMEDMMSWPYAHRRS